MYLLNKPKSKKNIGGLNEDFIESLEDIELFWEWNQPKKKKYDFEEIFITK